MSATIKAVKQAKPTQDPSEIQRMIGFYGATYAEVYLIHCLNCERVIGVECAPTIGTESLITDRGRALFTYQALCLSVRERIDSTPDGGKMYGYECICGNRTIDASVELGIVPQQTVHVNSLSKKVIDKGQPLRALSPFESADMVQTVKQNEAQSGYKADYELAGNNERYETFKLERVK